RLLYRPRTGTTEVASVGIACASKGDVTPAGEKFCEILRKISDGATAAKPKPARPYRTTKGCGLGSQPKKGESRVSPDAFSTIRPKAHFLRKRRRNVSSE